jgi:hypothetical protein
MPHKVSESAVRLGHEPGGVWEKPTFFVALGLLVSVPVLMVCVWLQFKWSEGGHYHGLSAPALQSPKSQPQFAPPEPRLIVTSGQGLGILRTNEETELTSYGWIDRGSNVVRIPIERAMVLIAQRGLPSLNGRQTGESEYDLILERSRQRQGAPIKEAK